MGNEKNFVLTVIITLAIMMAYQSVIQKFFPQYVAEKKTTLIPLKDAPQEQIQAVDNSATTSEPLTEEQTIARIKTEKSYHLENNNFIIKISGDNADIQTIGLKSFLKPTTKLPEDLLGTSLALTGIFNTNELIEGAAVEEVIQTDQAVQIFYLKNNLIIEKKIGFSEEKYAIYCQIGLKNNSDKEKILAYDIVAAHRFSSKRTLESRYSEAVIMKPDKKLHKKNLGGISRETEIPGEVRFAGIKTRYFSMLMLPSERIASAFYRGVEQGKGTEATVGVRTEKFVIAPQQTIVQTYVLYAGPNIHEDMAALNADLEYVRGRGLMAGLSEILLLILRFLYRVFKNYGFAVIGLSFIANIALYPLTFKSLSSMKEMQSLQPLVEKLKIEYKDNQQKLNKEIMELYKKHKVNPAGGCLPIILQMPVFIALYGVLMSAIELRGATFFGINDLSAPDALITFSTEYPFIGNSLNVLPLLMVATSFIQQKRTTPSQGNDQQKAMLAIMPIMLGFFFYGLPSGLVIYFITNSLFSLLVQWRMGSTKNN